MWSHRAGDRAANAMNTHGFQCKSCVVWYAVSWNVREIPEFCEPNTDAMRRYLITSNFGIIGDEWFGHFNLLLMSAVRCVNDFAIPCMRITTWPVNDIETKWSGRWAEMSYWRYFMNVLALASLDKCDWRMKYDVWDDVVARWFPMSIEKLWKWI
jgi:hypothetical protein